jgi:hypothetical protein
VFWDPVALEVLAGNIHILTALAIVIGFRWPAAWAFVLLTKVTPGIGLLWFLSRREWKAAAVALLATATLVVVSFMLDPDAWGAWVGVLTLSRWTGHFWSGCQLRGCWSCGRRARTAGGSFRWRSSSRCPSSG